MTAGKLFGFGGWMTAGKDAAIDHLVAAHGWTRMGMSDPLHEAMLALDPIVDWDYVTGAHVRYSTLVERVGYVEAKKNPEVRRLLQKLGTEIGRDMIHENVWVDVAHKKIVPLLAEGVNVAISGVRFPNELEMIRGLGGKSVWVHRPGVGPVGDAHASEAALTYFNFDVVLMNDGTLDDLHRRVEELI